MTDSARIVVALGGNALSDPTRQGTIADQFARTRETAVALCDVMEAGHRILITHGNGPQVGSILRRVELSQHVVYPIDLGLCVADSQGGMGYMICQCMTNELMKRGIDLYAISLVTTVQVDLDDPAFAKPTKPIGSFYTADQAAAYQAEEGWQMIEVPGKGFRRVVPSPKPLAIKPIRPIRRLFDAGELVVACGGGGIPVVMRDGWGYEGLEAVVDKDLSAALLAVGLDADLLAIVTDQECVWENFGTAHQRRIECMTAAEAQACVDRGQFPAGSMGPKVQAAVNFVTQSTHANPSALITSDKALLDAIAGRAGSRFVRE